MAVTVIFYRERLIYCSKYTGPRYQIYEIGNPAHRHRRGQSRAAEVKELLLDEPTNVSDKA